MLKGYYGSFVSSDAKNIFPTRDLMSFKYLSDTLYDNRLLKADKTDIDSLISFSARRQINKYPQMTVHSPKMWMFFSICTF